MKYKLLLFEDNNELLDEITAQIKKRFGITVSIETILIRTIPKYLDYEGKTIYNTDKYSDYKLITDYYPIRGDNVINIEDMDDIEYLSELIAGFYLKPKIWFTDDTEWAVKMLNKLPDEFSYDCETKGLKIEDRGEFTMHSFSLDAKQSFVLIDTPKIRQIVLDFLTTTEKKVICHNLAFDGLQIFYHTGKHIKNYEDTQLIAQAYLNDVNQPRYGLKALAGHIGGDWATEKGSFELYEDSEYYQNPQLVYKGTNLKWKQYNLPLVFYAGLDTFYTRILWKKYSAYEPTWKSVDIEDILPIIEPRYYEETPRYFYENVLKPVIPDIIEITNTPMPLNLKTIAQIKKEALDAKIPAYEKLRNFPSVTKFMDKDIRSKIKDFLQPLMLKQSREPIREYKHTPKDRTIVLNHLFKEDRDTWKIKDIKDKIKELQNENN
ncbi:MAG: hypothetical protein KAI79_12055 [Bacteroidales bacterium]|nr:hypothetical protein [Bacteroidales bacterium]